MKTLSPMALVYFFCLISLIGCEQEPIAMEVKPQPQKIVISSVKLSDNCLIVSISKTTLGLNRKALEDKTGKILLEEMDKIMLKEAQVSLVKNGQTFPFTTSNETPGLYACTSLQLNDFDKITLNVYDPETDLSAFAEAIVLPQVKMERSIIKSQGLNSILNIKFTDPADINNWYVVTYFALSKGPDKEEPVNIDHQLIKQNKWKQLDYFLLNDKTIKKREYEANLLLKGVSEGDSVIVTLSNIEEGYYKYLDARKQGNHLLGSIINEPFNYPTNVKDGFGYFDAHTADLKVLKVLANSE